MVRMGDDAVEVQLVAGRLDDLASLALLARRVDCVVNSANAALLTRGVSGIAGALLALGGEALLRESDAAKAAAGGEVPVGRAVWTGAGALGCRGIAHAVALRYGPRGREPATPAAVEAAFLDALRVADEHACASLACYVMCARAGFSTVPSSSDAPAVMLAAMLAAIEAFRARAPRERGLPRALRKILLFVPAARLLRAVAPAHAPHAVLWCDDGARAARAVERLRRAGARAERADWDAALSAFSAREEPSGRGVEKSTGAGRSPSAAAWALVVGWEARDVALEQLRAARAAPRHWLRVVCSAVAASDSEMRVEAWCAGAHWVTASADELVDEMLAAELDGI
ncbi:hypothetical protein KFE25_012803 [Diacronema lutheri]|uniref:Macro domain-containing protein n=1 Tax=Diacronema lutheri TaxID=2081491 RepID=A0A8J5X4X3_DIALT|nr:hypothetical protein KFE25_012803 [Diacronema lutheri]